MPPVVNRLDHTIIAFIHRLPAGVRPVMQAASLLGQPGLAAVLLALVGGFGWMRGDTVATSACLLALAALLVSLLLKMVIRRSRPDTYRPKIMRTFSFPSGHAAGSATAYLTLAWLATAGRPALALVALLAAAAFSFLIGVSRVYLGAHYPTDVIGGWLLGLAMAAFIMNVNLPVS